MSPRQSTKSFSRLEEVVAAYRLGQEAHLKHASRLVIRNATGQASAEGHKDATIIASQSMSTRSAGLRARGTYDEGSAPSPGLGFVISFSTSRAN